MRRTFPRIPSSPQATTTAETPAHYAPTPFVVVGSSFRGGDWECQSLICPILFRVQVQRYTKNVTLYMLLYKKDYR